MALEANERRSRCALYVHWPFCVSKCPYCDFNSHVRASIDQDEWRDALLADLAHEARLLPGRTLTSIFFGGGTPSLMDPATVEAIIDAAHGALAAPPTTSRSRSRPIPIRSRRRASPISPQPASTACRSACRASTTRRSRFLGRAHSAREGFARARNRAEAFPPRQLRPHLRASRRHRGQLVGDACPGAVARHHAPLALPADDRAGHALRQRWSPRGEFEPLDADTAAALYELTDAMTSAAGLPAYEISNHAGRGQREPAQPHLLALRRLCGRRPRRARPPPRHAHGPPPQAGELPVRAARATATASPRKRACRQSKRADEALVMGLRLREGIDAGAIADRFGLDRDRRLERGSTGWSLPATSARDGIAHRADGRAGGCCSIISSARSPRRGA